MTLSAINHKSFDKLLELTGNCNKAILLDKIIFWWQNSTYTLNDDQIWFTRSLDMISEASGIKKRTVQRYMDSFINDGLIEKRCVLIRKKNLYIRVTSKLLAILKPSSSPKAISKKSDDQEKRSFFDKNGHIEMATVATSYIRNKEKIVNNNVIKKFNVIPSKNTSFKTNHQIKDTNYLNIEKQIEGLVPNGIKKRIKGMMKNLEQQDGLRLNNKDRLFSEIIFSITNPQQFIGINTPDHKINIIAKLLRQRKWATPKGFYNHFGLGQHFKDKEICHQQNMLKQKLDNELLGIECPNKIAEIQERFQRSRENLTNTSKLKNFSNKEPQLIEKLNRLEREISSEQRHLEKCLIDFDNGVSYVSQSLIDSVNNKINKLKIEHENLSM